MKKLPELTYERNKAYTTEVQEAKSCCKKILMVDDQIFNINALMIILQHCVKIDVK